MTVRKFDKLMRSDGWFVCSENKHRKYRHPTKSNHVCIPTHNKEIHTHMANRLLKEAGIR